MINSFKYVFSNQNDVVCALPVSRNLVSVLITKVTDSILFLRFLRVLMSVLKSVFFCFIVLAVLA